MRHNQRREKLRQMSDLPEHHFQRLQRGQAVGFQEPRRIQRLGNLRLGCAQRICLLDEREGLCQALPGDPPIATDTASRIMEIEQEPCPLRDPRVWPDTFFGVCRQDTGAGPLMPATGRAEEIAPKRAVCAPVLIVGNQREIGGLGRRKDPSMPVLGPFPQRGTMAAHVRRVVGKEGGDIAPRRIEHRGARVHTRCGDPTHATLARRRAGWRIRGQKMTDGREQRHGSADLLMQRAHASVSPASAAMGRSNPSRSSALTRNTWQSR